MTSAKAPASAIAAASAETRSACRSTAALHLEAAGRVDRLRHQPDMAHDRDAALGQKPHGVGHLGTAFELDRGATGLGQNPRRAAERLLARFLIAAERHVDDHQRLRTSRA